MDNYVYTTSAKCTSLSLPSSPTNCADAVFLCERRDGIAFVGQGSCARALYNFNDTSAGLEASVVDRLLRSYKSTAIFYQNMCYSM